MALNCTRCGKKRGMFEAISADMGATEYTCEDCKFAIEREREERFLRAKELAKTMPVSTTFDLAGFNIIRNLGIVRGIIVRSRSVLGTVGASLQTIIGGDITLFTQLCEQTRRDAFEAMLIHAGELEADGVVGIRYDATEIAPGVTEVLAYGTAVKTKTVEV
jgi:uncharacterized protein YbjQ (UPF0145 family)